MATQAVDAAWDIEISNAVVKDAGGNGNPPMGPLLNRRRRRPTLPRLHKNEGAATGYAQFIRPTRGGFEKGLRIGRTVDKVPDRADRFQVTTARPC